MRLDPGLCNLVGQKMMVVKRWESVDYHLKITFDTPHGPMESTEPLYSPKSLTQKQARAFGKRATLAWIKRWREQHQRCERAQIRAMLCMEAHTFIQLEDNTIWTGYQQGVEFWSYGPYIARGQRRSE